MNELEDKKTIGILGGMGPYATVMFLKNVLDLTKANKDWDHIRTITDSNVDVPSRSRAVLFGEKSPLEGMVESCKKLENYPVDAIYIPCNSAGYWADQVQKQIKVPIVNIVSVATEYIFQNYALKKITSLGGMVNYINDLYETSSKTFGGEHVKISRDLQNRVVDIIERVKKNGTSSELKTQFKTILNDTIKETSAEGIILACTEFSGFRDIQIDVPVVDSSYVLAKHLIDVGKNGKKISLNSNKIKEFWDSRSQKLKDERVGFLQSTMLTSNEMEADEKWNKEKSTLLDIIKPYLKKNLDMLELGCGIGRWSRVFSKFVNSVDAFDYSEPFIDIAKEISKNNNVTNIIYKSSDVTNIFPTKKYDYIVSVALLHYLNETQYQKAIGLFKKFLNKGGIAIFRESFGYNKRFELHGFYSNILNDEYNAVYRTSDDIIESLGSDFSVLYNQISLEPTEKKPETCQKILLLRKTK